MMRVVLQDVRSDDARTSAELARGEVVEHHVDLQIDGETRTFTVFVRANVLPQLDAGVVYGEALLEELLRFDPGALNELYAAVGRRRRGQSIALPLTLVDESPGARAGERA